MAGLVAATRGRHQTDAATQCYTSVAVECKACCTVAGPSKATQYCSPTQLVSTGTQAASLIGNGTSLRELTKKRRLAAEGALEMFCSLPDSASDAGDDSADDFEAAPLSKSASTDSGESDDFSAQVASGKIYRQKRLTKKVRSGRARVDRQNTQHGNGVPSSSGWTTQKPSDIPEHCPERSPIFSPRLCTESTPSDAFGLYFDAEVWQMIADETNVHAEQEGLAKNWQPLSVKELQAYVGMLVMMSIHHLPRVSLYWSSDRFFNVGEISGVMVFKRYQQITACLHLNDDADQAESGSPRRNRCYKRLMDLLNEKFRKEYKPSSHLAVYRSQMLLKDQASVEPDVPVKPRKTRGYKVWTLSDSETGYLCKLDVYQGRSERRPPNRTLSEHIVLSLVDDVVDEGSQVFFDSFFSSPKLLLRLRERGVYACGAFRSSRRDLPAEVRTENELPRGSFVYRSNGPVSAYQWRDMKNVHVMSNFHDPEEEAVVERKLPCGKKIRVTCPACVRDYYRWMGCVKHFEQTLNAYPVERKSRKGWHRVFHLLVDAAVINAFVQCTALNAGNSRDLLQFKLVLGRQLIDGQTFRYCNRNPRVDYRRKCGQTGVPREVRFQAQNHFPQLCATRRRCRWCSTKQRDVRTKYVCSVCNVPLCAQCFSPFHSNST